MYSTTAPFLAHNFLYPKVETVEFNRILNIGREIIQICAREGLCFLFSNFLSQGCVEMYLN